MSELIQKNDNCTTIRWKLLTGVSALALTAYVSTTGVARADDADHPLVWIELGGQMESLQGTSSPFIAPFMLKTPTPGPYSDDIFINGQKPGRFAFGGEGKISFQPADSDWVFSAAIRYGRSNANEHIHHQSPVPVFTSFVFGNYAAAYADIKSTSRESHAIVDFSAGRDIGIGAFGHDGHSTLSLGVRFAQFSTDMKSDAYARPSVIPQTLYAIVVFPSFNGYSMNAHAERKFHGVGPSLSWEASAALAGNKQDGEITLDWGVNGAVLFGRQRAKLNHTTHAYHLPGTYYGYYYLQSLYPQLPHPADRSRSVTVPNVGGFVGVSLKWPNAKVSIGYRADVFFGAMDIGIDVAKKSNVTFNGPYASISVGLP